MPVTENRANPAGRKQTDKSLKAERAKADESLSEGQDTTERQADDAVNLSRAEADEARTVARHDADDTNETDERLRQERQNADDALEIERRHMDSVLEHERSEKRAVQNRLFQSERIETDRNLTDERRQSDVAVLRAANVLSEEQTSHTATRAALTTRDEFLAIVSHDLRNPLGSISLATGLLKELPFYAAADADTREYLEIIDRNAAEALRLIGDLLDMERIAGGKLGLKVAPHDIGAILREAHQNCALHAESKGLTLTSPAHDVVAIASCDRDRIAQVLSNLIGNAIKFTPAGGSIALTLVASATEIQASVTDTGPGIPDELRKIVFDRFWQIGKHDRHGLGLGLYISTMIVEAHGGRIWVDSRMGEGSSFHFALPVMGPS